MWMSGFSRLCSAILVVSFVSGCGGSADPGSATVGNSAGESDGIDAAGRLPDARTAESRPAGVVASIDNTNPANKLDGSRSNPQDEQKSPVPEDEATQLLREIQQLRASIVPTDLAEARKARRDRNERIIDMATKVLRLTTNEESSLDKFHGAVKQLLEARFQMALAGTQDDVELLYADVQALNERDDKSIAAAEGVYYIARFAHTKAGLLGKSQPVWFETLSRWAREFSDRFPQQTQRAVSLLFGAARSCELQAMATDDQELATRLMTESRLCYTALAEKFATSDQGQEATASLRRMSLAGQTLSQFSGPTLDGGFVSSDDFTGKPTIIFFWDSDSEEFTTDVLPVLLKISTALPSSKIRMVGVALDEDEAVLNEYLETHKVPGQQIFFTHGEQRSWDSPLVRFWGIAQSPTIWLLDSGGKVLSTSLEAAELVAAIQKLLK
ncbi:MAG: TlpA disulfide reductase family protein [Planctomycetota bacterium]|nr:TlpA disulfide reductase family protein [Planctomycetota bacterium]